MSNYKEIYKLRNMLENAGIPFVFENRFLNGAALMYPSKEAFICSAVEHDRSMGRAEDKLEIMGLLTKEERKYDMVAGYLTAVDVFERIKKHWLNNTKIN